MLRRLMRLVDRRTNYSEVLGTIPTESGEMLSKGAERWPEMYSTVVDAARELRHWGSDGAA